MCVMHGPRQVGKTAFMTSLMKRLVGSGELSHNIVYFDIEDFDLLAIF